MIKMETKQIMMFLLLVWTTQVSSQGDVSEQITLRYSITEELEHGSIIGNVFSDVFPELKNSGLGQQSLEFTFLSPPVLPLQMDKFSGQIQTTGRIDRDDICPGVIDCTQKLDVVVRPMFEIIKVSIQIQDINDNQPIFQERDLVYSMLESADLGTDIVLPTAMDPDSGVFGVQQYQLLPESDIFELTVKDKAGGSKDVQLVLISELDRELQDSYWIQIIASDSGNPPKSGSLGVTIQVQDANDNDPVFDKESYEVTLAENSPIQATILQVHASDPDSGSYGEVLYRFSEHTRADLGHMFSIVNTTGEIYISGMIDYEEGSVYHLSVMAQDKGPDSVSSDTTVIVHVTDVNDNSPQITVNALNSGKENIAEVQEHSNLGTFVAHITVVDHDEGQNSYFQCELDNELFVLQRLNVGEYKIVTNGNMNREQETEYDINIKCRDKGDLPQTSVKYIHVNVVDINDNSPVFSHNTYPGYIAENNFEGMYVTSVTATDADVGLNGEIEYRLDEAGKLLFYINPTTGSVTAQKVFDREQIQQAKFKVIAVDRGTPQMTGTANVVVRITDLNDENPVFTQPSYSFGVFENEPNGTDVGVVTAVDADEDPYNRFTYSLLQEGQAGTFAIDPLTGRLTAVASFDREATPVYYLTVLVTDVTMAHMSSSASVTVHVNDKNDNSPIIDYPSAINNTIHVPSQAPAGHLITKVKAHDLDLDANANLTYELIKGNENNAFRLDPSSGRLYVNHAFQNEETFELRVLVTDHGIPPQFAAFDFDVVANHSLTYSFRSGEGVQQGSNFTIAVSLACVSAFIAVVLVVAIILLRKQGRKEKNMDKYNGRMEALKMLQTSIDGIKEDNSINKTQPPPEGSSLQCGSVCIDMESGCNELDSENTVSLWLSAIQAQDIKNARECASAVPDTSNDNVAPPAGQIKQQTSQSGQTLTLTQAEIQVHQLLEKLRKDHDADSAYSAVSSCPDSGHGPSEEGEADPHTHVCVQGEPGCDSRNSLRADRCFIVNSLGPSPSPILSADEKLDNRWRPPPGCSSLSSSASTLSLHTFAHTNSPSGREQRLASQFKSAAYRSLRLHRLGQNQTLSEPNKIPQICANNHHSDLDSQAVHSSCTQGHVSRSVEELLTALRTDHRNSSNSKVVDPEELCLQLQDHFNLKLDTFV